MSESPPKSIRVGLPSKGSLADPMFSFLKECGLSIDRQSSRSYSASFRGLEGIEITFLRAPEIVERLHAGDIELGVSGRDLYEENQHESPSGQDTAVIVEDLGFGRVDLLLAVPEGWLDVEDQDDLRSLCRERGEEGRPLRIATKFPRLVGDFLKSKGIAPVRFVPSHGATEAAPRRGDADLIADLSETGTTLAENGLRPLRGGNVLRSAACVIASAASFRKDPSRLGLLRPVIEAIEARLVARSFLRAEVVVPRKLTERLVEEISAHVAHDPARGVSVSPIVSSRGRDPTDLVSFLLERSDSERARRRLAGLGVDHVMELTEVGRLYAKESPAMARLEAIVRHKPRA